MGLLETPWTCYICGDVVDEFQTLCGPCTAILVDLDSKTTNLFPTIPNSGYEVATGLADLRDEPLFDDISL
jgi:hypothetical protein